MADIVACSRFPAAVASFAPMAVRKRRISERTRVRFARFTSARWRACCARLMTDFLRFLTLVGCPWGIHCSFLRLLKFLRLAEAPRFVKPAIWRIFARLRLAAAKDRSRCGAMREQSPARQEGRAAPPGQLPSPAHHHRNLGRIARRRASQ